MVDYFNLLSTTEIPVQTYEYYSKKAVQVSVVEFDTKFYYFVSRKGKKKVSLFFRNSENTRAWFVTVPAVVISHSYISTVINRLIDNLQYEKDFISFD